MRIFLQCVLVVFLFQLLSACSINQLSARVSSLFIEHRVEALNRQNDLAAVKKKMLSDIGRLESMLAAGVNTEKLHIYAAQAYYSYAFAFIEDNHTGRAMRYYHRAYEHACLVLQLYGVSEKDLQGRSDRLSSQLAALPKHAVDGLYWTALSWAKLIELRQPDIISLTQLHKTALLMKQVISFDEHYNLAGPHLFFAVYYSVRPSYLGGDDRLAQQYFDQARRYNRSRLLLVDYLQARYLGQGGSQPRYRRQLQKIIGAPDNLYPDQALSNAVAKKKAAILLAQGHG